MAIYDEKLHDTTLHNLNVNISSNLYYPASPNAYDPFQSPIDHMDRPPSARSCNPRSLDLDDPGPIAQFPFS